MTDKIMFKRNVRDINGSTVLTIPPELCRYLELVAGDEIDVCGDIGKHGKFISFWKRNKQIEDENIETDN